MSKEDNNGSIDYQKLNDEEIKKYFEDSKIDFNPKVKITDKQFNDNISKLIRPNINKAVLKNKSNILIQIHIHQNKNISQKFQIPSKECNN